MYLYALFFYYIAGKCETSQKKPPVTTSKDEKIDKGASYQHVKPGNGVTNTDGGNSDSNTRSNNKDEVNNNNNNNKNSKHNKNKAPAPRSHSLSAHVLSSSRLAILLVCLLVCIRR